MKYEWKDLERPLSCFTVRNATMINLNTGKVVQHYSANTKIVVVQKCITPEKTYYRTQEAYHHYLNFAFEASAFGLPNEKAPSAPRRKPNSLNKSTKQKSESHATLTKKIKNNPKAILPKDGEGGHKRSWLNRFFRRKNG